MNSLLINVDKIIEEGIGLEAYFIIHCIYTNDKDLLFDYVNKCKKINTNVFLQLESDGYILIKDRKSDNIYYELLSLTDRGNQVALYALKSLSPKSESNFDEFRQCYPNRVKKGAGTRPLHTDLKRCKSLYDKLLMETTHSILCKCAKLCHNEAIRSNSEEYMQNLPTWLHQRNYMIYADECENLNIDESNSQITNLDAI
jgi:hypothetical protein